MAIYKGNKKVVAVYKGSTPINKIYKGSTLVFQKSGGGGNTHLFEGTATGNFKLQINGNQIIPITPDADGKWFYDTDEQITSLSEFLYGQLEVTSVDLSNFDLTDIPTNSMFEESTYITSIKFNNTKSIKLVEAARMFYACRFLVSLDLSNFDTSKLKKATYMFYACSKLVSLDLGSFDTSSLTSALGMFYNCNRLVSLDLSNFDTSSLTDASYMFYSCSKLVSLDLSNFDLSKVTSYNNMFYNCNNLTHIKCKQAFKDWCITNQDTIKLPDTMREGGSGTWEIVG